MPAATRQDQASKRIPKTIALLASAGVIGSAAGVLTYLASHSVPQALLAAGAATGGSTSFLCQISNLGRDQPRTDVDQGPESATEASGELRARHDQK